MSTDGSVPLLLTLGLILMLGPTVRRLSQRSGVPVSVAYIVIGLLVGSALGRIAPQSAHDASAFHLLAQLGVVALLFRVGLRSHTSALLAKLPDASFIWIVNVVGSSAVGYAVARWGLDWSVETSLVIGTAFSATSIAVSVSVWDEMGRLDGDQGQTLIDIAELDDLSAAVLLAILLGTLPAISNGDDGIWRLIGVSAGVVVAKLALFIAACYLFAHHLEARFTQFNQRFGTPTTTLTISILGAGLAIAAIAEYLGFSVAIGALFAGLAFSRDPEAVRTEGTFSVFYDFLTPFFFIHIGMQTDIAVLLQAAGVGLVLAAAAALAKLAFTALPAMWSMSRRQAAELGVSMIPRAEIALVVIYECRVLDASLVTPEVFAAMVLMSIATSVAAPIALRRMLTEATPG